MASQTLASVNDIWPNGTVVSVYLAEQMPPGASAPSGSAVTTATVASGSVSFAGLSTGRRYLAWAAGQGRRFLIGPGSIDLKRIARLEDIPSSGGSMGAVTPFRPEDFGAVAGIDSTAAVKACIAACVAEGIANGSYYGEVQFSVNTVLDGPLTQGGATKGNALIPLPVLPDTGKKFILVLKGSEEQAVQWHWNQTVPQDAGVVLRTTVAGTNHGTYGRASVIGGPTPEQGYGAVSNVWSNMMIVVDGIEIMVPNNPAICGFDFRGVAEMNFKNGSCLINATTGTRVAATSGWQFGLATPENNNNANSRVGKFVGMGQNFAGYINEHCDVDHFTAIYCVAGIEFGSSGQSTGHGIHVGHLLVEACDVGIGADDGAYPVKVTIDTFDFEIVGFALINDPGGKLQGEVRNVSGIGVNDVLVDSPSGGVNAAVRGAANLNIYDKGRQSGVQGTSPGVPASTVALRNPYWRDAFVSITGGTTVSNVQITDSGGTAQSVATSTPAQVLVPTGAYITLTYFGAPSWKWTLI